MNTLLAILLIMLAFFGGILLGMYLLRRQVEKEFAENPRLNVEAVRMLLSAKNQVKHVFNKFTVKSSTNKKQQQLKIKTKNKLLSAALWWQTEISI